jgi:hypothetical protein
MNNTSDNQNPPSRTPSENPPLRMPSENPPLRMPSENPPLRMPSARITAALAAATLAIGVALGAAIGPAPSSSFALGRLLPLLPALSPHASASPTATAVQPPPVAPQATPAATSESRPATKALSAPPATSAATTSTGPSETSAPSSAPPTSTVPKRTLAPVTHVWLIELSGSSFAEAIKQPSAAPYIDAQAVPAGTLLSGWSGLDGSAFAGGAALLSSTPPLADLRSVLDTIVQPPCPEGAAGAQCVAGTPGGLAAADEFLKATAPTITANAAYRESGLIVVTFATVADATATGLPAGASTATLTAEPPAGVLLISPFAKAGAKPSSAFDPISPKQSIEKLLRP